MKLPEFCRVLEDKLQSTSDKDKLALSSLSLQQAFKVAADEVAFLKIDFDSETLCFVWPEKLSRSGSIPLQSKTSYAAITARENKAQLHNRFNSKQHTAIFEQVNLGKEDAKKGGSKSNVIQKIMSAPLLMEGKTVGAVQVSRKADDINDAGPDFTDIELEALTEIAKVIGKYL